MPARNAPDIRESEDAVRAAVVRLSRPHRDGGTVIERAAILAEGMPSAAIEAWVIDHGGKPEAAPPAPAARGLNADRGASAHAGPPRRYVMPIAALVSAS